MRYITDIDEEIKQELERIIREDKHYKSRYRAQAILLSNQGKNVNDLSVTYTPTVNENKFCYDIKDLMKKRGLQS